MRTLFATGKARPRIADFGSLLVMPWWLLTVLLLLFASAWIARRRFRFGIEAERARVRATPPAVRNAHLPEILGAFRVDGFDDARWIRVEQTGEMRLQPDGPWKSFTATQIYGVAEPSFVWDARFRGFHVVDSLVRGRGRLEARILGVLPVMKASGPSVTRAQLLRYLGEIAWVPPAMRANPAISWSPLGDQEVLGTVDLDGEHVELRFSLDGAGDIVQVEGLRERSVGGEQAPTPWVGVFSDYQLVGGVRIPTRGEVRWELETGPFSYWRGIVTALDIGCSAEGS